jgi:hypothetical protein
MKMLMVALGMVFVMGVTSCAIGPAEPCPTVVASDTGAIVGLNQRLDEIVDDELHWRFPNSHANLRTENEASLNAELQRGRILQKTLEFAESCGDAQLDELKKQTRVSSPDDECRAIVLCRVLAACGVLNELILSIVPEPLRDEDFIRVAVEEGYALRRLG